MTSYKWNLLSLYFISQTACLGPPEFNISACSNCVNVTVKILSSLLNLYKTLDYTIKVKTVEFEEQVSGLFFIFKKHLYATVIYGHVTATFLLSIFSGSRVSNNNVKQIYL